MASTLRVVDHASGSYLYRGIVSDFTFDRDGALDTIVLTDAHRRRLVDDREEGEPRPPVGPSEPDERYYEIRGDFLVLRSAEIRTLNLDYFAVTLEESQEGCNVSLQVHPAVTRDLPHTLSFNHLHVAIAGPGTCLRGVRHRSNDRATDHLWRHHAFRTAITTALTAIWRPPSGRLRLRPDHVFHRR